MLYFPHGSMDVKHVLIPHSELEYVCDAVERAIRTDGPSFVCVRGDGPTPDTMATLTAQVREGKTLWVYDRFLLFS